MDMKELEKALNKLATGATTREVAEEYVAGDDGLVLKSRKCITKDLAPDLSSIKLLLNMKSLDTYDNMTDEDLEKEKERLIKLLEEN